mgnify:CR=1 FL=1
MTQLQNTSKGRFRTISWEVGEETGRFVHGDYGSFGEAAGIANSSTCRNRYARVFDGAGTCVHDTYDAQLHSRPQHHCEAA